MNLVGEPACLSHQGLPRAVESLWGLTDAPECQAPATAPTTRPHSQPCATQRDKYGTITDCPDAGTIGTVLTLSGQGCSNHGSKLVQAVFLGPQDYIGGSGGGTQINIPEAANRFRTTFQIPATYTAGGKKNPTLPITPNSHYAFGVYPASICYVRFTVTPSGSP